MKQVLYRLLLIPPVTLVSETTRLGQTFVTQDPAVTVKLLQQNHPLVNWGRRLTDVDLYNGRKSVLFVDAVGDA